MKKEYIKEISRDLLALGGLPFFFLAMARSLIGDYFMYTYQLLLGLVIITLVSLFVKANLHLARSLVVLIFSVLFYNVDRFTGFAIFVWLLLLGSTFYLKQDKKFIINGVILGAIASIITYYSLNFYYMQ